MNIDEAIDRAISLVEYLKAAKDRGHRDAPDNVWHAGAEGVLPGQAMTLAIMNQASSPQRVLFAVCFNEFHIHRISFGTALQIPFGGCNAAIFDPRLGFPTFEFPDTINPHQYIYIVVENLRRERQSFEIDFFSLPVDACSPPRLPERDLLDDDNAARGIGL